MSDILYSSLVLKTSDFTKNSDYLIGTAYSNGKNLANAKLSSLTWNNIDLRSLLGDMYDKYDKFNLCLNTIHTAQANTIDINPDCKNVTVKISGLPFLNSGYNVKSLVNSNSVSIGTFNFSNGTSASQIYNNNIVTFAKSQDICNITIEYQRISDEVVVNTNLSLVPITNLTGTGSINTNALTLSASNTNIVIGTRITHANIPANSFVTSVSGTAITINNFLTGAIATSAVTLTNYTTYPNTIFIFDIFGIPKTV